MLFNSYIFILLFLPLSIILYFSLNRMKMEKMAKVVLIGMSLWFYAYFRIEYLILIVASVLFNFFFSKWILAAKKQNLRKISLAVGICANIAVIFYFKYFNFFLENLQLISGRAFDIKEILMPLGISFFTFQQISYLVDSYRNETAEYGFIDYALFVTFFPQLVAGPIVLHEEMIPQLNDKARKTFSHEKMAQGIYLFAVGLFKKVMIADILGKGVNWGYSNLEYLTGPDAVIVSVLYTLQIYFDFSGYCDMACGIASMFHLELPLNFNSPYKAVSILDFWKRWHMSLTRFLRKYIYFPLGGSKKGVAITMLNVMIVFGVSGIWHGAEWTFIIWGLLHGVANVLCRLFKKVWDKVPKFFAWLATFIFVDLMWIFFRAPSLGDAGRFFKKIFSPWEMKISNALLQCFDLLEFTYIEDHMGALGNIIAKFPFLHLLFILSAALIIALIPRNCHEKTFKPGVWNGLGSIILIVWSVFSLSGISTFLYFNF